jgi:hypothetical protein
MDHFTFGMFAEQEAYEGEKETMVDENEADGWKEPMDFGDLLSHNQRFMDLSDEELKAIVEKNRKIEQ